MRFQNLESICEFKEEFGIHDGSFFLTPFDIFFYIDLEFKFDNFVILASKFIRGIVSLCSGKGAISTLHLNVM